MTTTILIVIVVVLLALAVGAFLFNAQRQRNRRELRERFGPEYDRAVDEHGSRRQAEQRLSNAAARRDQAEIRALTDAERTRYTQRWTTVQAEFVDDPVSAAGQADTLVSEVMRARGYPLDEVDSPGDLVATEHVELASHYRAGNAVARRASEASTEELRQAFVHYRALFTELLGESTDGATAGSDGASAGRPTVDLTDPQQARARQQTAGGPGPSHEDRPPA